ncbi:MAG TPA: metalloregulator ArsR/SmtB family transcription factor [Clostridia bacterium]|nr:metalloregulator ArsR/SmtB family transcription factor [Clostridia bacterium]
MNEADCALICKALGDETRINIFKLIKDGEMCACKILEKFNFSQPTLSYHMKILVDSGLVSNRKVGKWRHYLVNKAVYEEFLAFISAK